MALSSIFAEPNFRLASRAIVGGASTTESELVLKRKRKERGARVFGRVPAMAIQAALSFHDANNRLLEVEASWPQSWPPLHYDPNSKALAPPEF